jgi:uncharacterized protein YutE (UPF0331/DUF86 family)
LNNYIRPRIETLLNELREDLDLIASKHKDDEWKRDHYRYTFTVSAQRIYNLLNHPLTEQKTASVKSSTKKELAGLRNIINEMINS